MIMDKPLSLEREEYIRRTANEGAMVPSVHVGELLWEIKRLRAGQERLQTLMRAGQRWDDRWLSSEALLSQEDIRQCFGWKPEPPAGARPFCTCKHTLRRHPDGGPCEFCTPYGGCSSYTPEGD